MLAELGKLNAIWILLDLLHIYRLFLESFNYLGTFMSEIPSTQTPTLCSTAHRDQKQYQRTDFMSETGDLADSTYHGARQSVAEKHHAISDSEPVLERDDASSKSNELVKDAERLATS